MCILCGCAEEVHYAWAKSACAKKQERIDAMQMQLGGGEIFGSDKTMLLHDPSMRKLKAAAEFYPFAPAPCSLLGCCVAKGTRQRTYWHIYGNRSEINMPIQPFLCYTTDICLIDYHYVHHFDRPVHRSCCAPTVDCAPMIDNSTILPYLCDSSPPVIYSFNPTCCGVIDLKPCFGSQIKAAPSRSKYCGREWKTFICCGNPCWEATGTVLMGGLKNPDAFLLKYKTELEAFARKAGVPKHQMATFESVADDVGAFGRSKQIEAKAMDRGSDGDHRYGSHPHMYLDDPTMGTIKAKAEYMSFSPSPCACTEPFIANGLRERSYWVVYGNRSEINRPTGATCCTLIHPHAMLSGALACGIPAAIAGLALHPTGLWMINPSLVGGAKITGAGMFGALGCIASGIYAKWMKLPGWDLTPLYYCDQVLAPFFCCTPKACIQDESVVYHFDKPFHRVGPLPAPCCCFPMTECGPPVIYSTNPGCLCCDLSLCIGSTVWHAPCNCHGLKAGVACGTPCYHCIGGSTVIATGLKDPDLFLAKYRTAVDAFQQRSGIPKEEMVVFESIQDNFLCCDTNQRIHAGGPALAMDDEDLGKETEGFTEVSYDQVEMIAMDRWTALRSES
jgi:hypothetical protein